MTTTAPEALDLQRAARDHLWLHFTRMGGYPDGEVPIIVRGDGCYLEDSKGKRYLDALAGLFSVNIGYGFGEEIGEAAAAQMRELPFYTNWGYAHPRAIELASEVASLTPGDLNRLFFVSGGSEAVESAWKLARQYYTARGDGRRWKAISRHVAYHGTTMGALSINGIPEIRAPFEPLVPGGATTCATRTATTGRPKRRRRSSRLSCSTSSSRRSSRRARTRSRMVIMEPVQNAGGSFTPPEGYWKGVREICDRYGILLCADEVITGFGRVGAWFGSERYDIRPDLMTIAKGLSSSYAAIGAVVASDRVMEPFMKDTNMYSHGITFGGHPVGSAIALEEHRDHEARAHRRARRGDAGHLPSDARAAARPADRRRRARHRLLLRDRARQGQGHARVVQRRGVRDAPSRLPLAAAVRARADLPCPTTAATRSSRSRRRSSPDSRSSTRSSRFSATFSPRPGRVCIGSRLRQVTE